MTNMRHYVIIRFMADLERLNAYYKFDDKVIYDVGRAADIQRNLSLSELVARYNVPDKPVHPQTTYKPFEVLTLRPNGDYDEHHARLLHTGRAMAVGNSLLSGLRLMEADPSSQIIIVGNPGELGHKYGKVGLRGRLAIRFSGDLTPVVDPYLTYLEEIGINTTEEIGYSWGADKSAAGSMRSDDHGITVKRGVWSEGVSVINRNRAELLLAFISYGNEENNYIQAGGGEPKPTPFDDLAALKNLSKYCLGLARPTNRAIAYVLARDGYFSRIEQALIKQDQMEAVVSYATASELVPNGATHSGIEKLKTKNPAFHSRLGEMALLGMHHAGCEDIDLNTAIILQSLRMPIVS